MATHMMEMVEGNQSNKTPNFDKKINDKMELFINFSFINLFT
jgi:hypothetical protein